MNILSHRQPLSDQSGGTMVLGLKKALLDNDAHSVRLCLKNSAPTPPLLLEVEDSVRAAVENGGREAVLELLGHIDHSVEWSCKKQMLSAAIQKNDLPLMNGLIRAIGGIGALRHPRTNPDQEARKAWKTGIPQPYTLLIAWKICNAMDNARPSDEDLRTTYRAARSLLSSMEEPLVDIGISKYATTTKSPSILSIGFYFSSAIKTNGVIESSSGTPLLMDEEELDLLLRTKPSNHSYIEAAHYLLEFNSRYEPRSYGSFYYSKDSDALQEFIESRTALRDKHELVIAIINKENEKLLSLLAKSIPYDESMTHLGKSWRPMHYACNYANTRAIELLHHHGALATMRPEDYWSPLAAVVESNDHSVKPQDQIQALGLLIQMGASIDEPDREGRTPLIEACAADQPHMVNALLSLGADLHATDNDGMTALEHCAVRQSGECISVIEAYLARQIIADPVDDLSLKPL